MTEENSDRGEKGGDLKGKVWRTASAARERLRAIDVKPLKNSWKAFRVWLRQNYLTPIYVIAAVLSPFWLLLLVEIISSLFDQLGQDVPTDPAEKRTHFYAIGLTITGLGAALAPPFILIRAFVNERNAAAAEQGLITSRITQAVEQLGAEKTVKIVDETPRYRKKKGAEDGDEDPWLRDNNGNPKPALRPDGKPIIDRVNYELSEPNLEVRLGGIYALERIARDSLGDHVTVMEILCAYIRENSHARPPQEHGLPALEHMPDDADDAARAAQAEAREGRFGYSGKLKTWARGLPDLRADIQAALTVIGRRGAEAVAREAAAERPYRLDLRSANLQRADLSGLHLGPALLSEARMEGAVLRGARMEGADLGGARMEGAVLRGARMEGAVLRGARMEGADLGGARMEGADLRGARMEGAVLREARMEGADLGGARMEGAVLRGARMEGADLGGARMEGAVLRGARMEGAVLREARMEGAVLGGARMEGADLGGARMEGALLSNTGLKSTVLRAESIRGSALRSVDLTEVSQIGPELLMTAFGDGSVTLPEGVVRPAHWPEAKIEDTDAFFGRWRWWRESEGLPWPPPGEALECLAEYEAVAPPDSAN